LVQECGQKAKKSSNFFNRFRWKTLSEQGSDETSGGASAARDGTDQIVFGKNAVLSYLKSELATKASLRVNKVFIARSAQSDPRLEQIRHTARSLKVPIVESDRRKLESLTPEGSNHQGVVATISPAQYKEWGEFLSELKEALARTEKNLFLVVLDGIEDPHNLGAIIRVAEASGAFAVLLPARRGAVLTGVVAKVSAGAVFTLPIVRIGNLVRTFDQLKEVGFWVAGLAGEGPELYTDADLDRHLAIVIGSEGAGLSRLTRENCDMLLKIPMIGKTESLNASVASGIMLYEVVRQNSLKQRASANKSS